MFETQFTPNQIQELFPKLVTQVQGPTSIVFKGVSSAEKIQKESLIFCAKEAFLNQALESECSGIILSPQAFEKLAANDSDLKKSKCFVLSPNPELLMALVSKSFVLPTPYRDFAGIPKRSGFIHPTALIEPTAEIASSAIIGPYVIIGAHVKIAKDAYIGAHCHIESFSSIGESSTLHSSVSIGSRVQIGKNCDINSHSVVGKEGFGYAHDHLGNHYRVPHLGWVILEDDVHLGACVTVDRGTYGETRIGQGSKLDNQVHIGHNCKIGRGCLITSGFKMAGSSEVGNFFICGGNSSITGHIKVGDGIRIAAYSGVTKSMSTPGEYGGLPLVPIQQHIKIKAAMVQLPEMRKQVQALMKKVFGDSEK